MKSLSPLIKMIINSKNSPTNSNPLTKEKPIKIKIWKLIKLLN